MNPAVGVEEFLWHSVNDAHDGDSEHLDRTREGGEEQEKARRDPVVELEHEVVGGVDRRPEKEAPENGERGN